MKKKIITGLLLLLLGTGVYLGYIKYHQVKPSVLTATGTIEATQVELNAKLAGTLQSLSISSGETVKKGQLIAVTTRNDLVAQKERDALGVLQAQAQLDDLTSGAREQEINNAQIAVNTAQTNLDQVSKDYHRDLALFQAQAIPQADMEKAATAFKQAQNQVDAAKGNLDLLLAGSRPDAIAAAKDQVAMSQAVLKSSEAQLADTQIICPINGTVLSKNFEAGEYVQAGASIATVADLNDMWVKVYIPTDDLPKIKLKEPIKVSVSGSAQKYPGWVEEIAAQGEFTPKTIQTKEERTNIVYGVKIKINNDNGTLKPGMPADVTFN